ncbi:MAG: hypothetical protein ACLPPF_12090 [Rhodomicrobium sp.]
MLAARDIDKQLQAVLVGHGLRNGSEVRKHSTILHAAGHRATYLRASLDGELKGRELAAFEALPSKDASCRRALNAIRRTEQALKQIGAEILFEPVPQFLLDVLSPLARE